VTDHSTRTTELFESISDKLSALENRFAPIAERASSAIDERLKNGIVPILRCLDTIAHLRTDGTEHATSALSAVANELESILESLEIERFSLQVHDALKQRVVGTRPTQELELDGTIAESTQDGFLLRNRVIRPQHVYLYKYKGS
jgi:molecular chaperone GrpE (heat shock protein)